LQADHETPSMTISLKLSHVADDVILWMICRDHAGASGAAEKSDVLAVYPESWRDIAANEAVRFGRHERLAVTEFRTNGDEVCLYRPRARRATRRLTSMA
jgi:hypothetical protein